MKCEQLAKNTRNISGQMTLNIFGTGLNRNLPWVEQHYRDGCWADNVHRRYCRIKQPFTPERDELPDLDPPEVREPTPEPDPDREAEGSITRPPSPNNTSEGSSEIVEPMNDPLPFSPFPREVRDLLDTSISHMGAFKLGFLLSLMRVIDLDMTFKAKEVVLRFKKKEEQLLELEEEYLRREALSCSYNMHLSLYSCHQD